MSIHPLPSGSLSLLGRLRRARAGGPGLWEAMRLTLFRNARIVRYDSDRNGLLIVDGSGRGRAVGAAMGRANAAASPEPVVLQFPAGSVLRKSVRLPAATAENLRAVLALEMDRETPFSADSVWFTYRIAARDRTVITVDLLVIPRLLFEECQARLAALGLTAHWVGLDASTGSAPARFRIAVGEGRWNLAPASGLLAAALALALLVTGLDLWQAQRQQAELDTVRSRAERALTLRRTLEAGPADAAAAVASRLSILTALTDAMPDGTWLDRLSIDGSNVEISGFAPDAAALLVRLGRSPPFQAAHFLGATVRDPRSQREHFQIAMSVAEDVP